MAVDKTRRARRGVGTSLSIAGGAVAIQAKQRTHRRKYALSVTSYVLVELFYLILTNKLLTLCYRVKCHGVPYPGHSLC